MHRQQEDLDLINFFLFIWKNRFLVIFFSFIGAFLGFTSFYAINYINNKDFGSPIFESKIEFALNKFGPPNFPNDKISADFENLFFFEDIFNNWKSENPQSFINFENFKKTKLIDGAERIKNKEEQLIIFKDYSIYIITKDLPLIDDFYDYTIYVNEVLTSKLVSFTQDLDKNIENINNKNPSINNYFHKKLAINQYFNIVENGERALIITPPTVPININSKLMPNRIMLRLVIFAILGALMGIFILIIKDAIHKRKNQI